MSHDVIVYQSSRATGFSDFVFTLVLAASLIVSALLAAAMVAFVSVELLAMPVWSGFIWFTVSSAMLLKWVWSFIICRLRYRIGMARDCLEVGSGWLRRDLDYGSIEWIQVSPVEQDTTWIKVRGRDVAIHLFLPPADVDICAVHLRERCPNAIYQDMYGKEHWPERTTQPSQVLWSKQRELQKKIVLILIFSVVSLFLLALMTVAAVAAVQGRKVLSLRVMDLPTIAIGLGFPFFIYELWKSIREWMFVRRRRIELEQDVR